MEITVVIPTYNRSHFLPDAIESVIRQTYPEWKILIVDDASTDNTPDVVEQYRQGDSRIQYIRMPKNAGISHVMNQALSFIDTDYFLQLDSDDWLEPDALEKLAEAIGRVSPETALFYGNVKMWRKHHGKWRMVKKIRHRPFQNKYQFLMYLTYMIHPRCYRTEAVREVGGWDTSDPYQGRIMEDRRICLKLIEKYPVHWINKSLYNRRKHGKQLTNRKEKYKRNRLRVMVVRHYLKKWGNRYQPVFGKKNGWIIIKKLKRKAGDR
ncbi:MAG: glycosyltransferase family 2 protein [Bacillaceae bacterium]|nr:glycosyltransferase family 2 protein [Bacillaceae bacterium]